MPTATIKHYVREGLVTPKESGRNIAYFDEAEVQRVQQIKDLQQNGHLPLRVIKDALDGKPALDRVIESIHGVLDARDRKEARTAKSLVAQGVSREELGWLEGIGAIRTVDVDGEPGYGGDDLELLRTLRSARKAGLTPEMLPLSIVADYVRAIQNLVRVELTMFEQGVVPRAGDNLAVVAEAATHLSERLVVLIRRRLILPTLRAMATKPARANVAKRARRVDAGGKK